MLSLPYFMRIAHYLIHEASKVILDVFSSGVKTPHIKPHATFSSDPVTIADIKSQLIIVGGIRHCFPKLSILAEEEIDEQTIEFKHTPMYQTILNNMPASNHLDTTDTLPVSELFCTIDPLDATQSFVDGYIQDVTVLVGLAHLKEPVAGLIGVPSQGRIVTVLRNTVEGLRHVDRVSDPLNPFHTTVRSHLHVTEQYIRRIARIPPFTSLKCGGTGLLLLHAAENRADAAVYPADGPKLWDVLPGDALLRALGGVIRSKGPVVYEYSREMVSGGFIASLSPALVDELSVCWDEHGGGE